MGTLLGWQGVLDVGEYPITWIDDETLPATHDDFDKLAYPEPSNTAGDVLNTPLGQPSIEPIKKGIILNTG